MGHYETLGITRDADGDTIKKAFRRMALKHHPDKGGDPDKFKAISEANEVLSDPEKRKRYDTYGANFENIPRHHPGSGFSVGDMSEVFGSIFGMGGIPTGFAGHRQPKQTKHNINLPMKDFYTGKKMKRVVSRLAKCSRCEGRGGARVHESRCVPCGGNGFIVSQNGMGFAIFQGRVKCQSCQSTGKTKRIEDPCPNCSASGRVSERVIIEPVLSPGDKSGTRCVFPGLGNYTGDDGATGDIVITIISEPSEFKRKGNDLHIDREITLKQCLVGFSMGVTHLDGRVVHLSVPSGNVTKPGTVMRIPKEGIPRGQGFLHVTFSVKFPNKLDEAVVNKIAETL